MGEDTPLTILFTDVEASTDLRTRRGDQVAHELLRLHEGLVRAEVKGHGGWEVKALGDGFMVGFTSARRGLGCAVAIQRALHAHRHELPEVNVRIGLNTGEVVREGDDVFGQAVHAAARIAARARGGEILVSEVVKQLVGSSPEFVFQDRGRFRLKGFPERFRLFEVPWVEDGGARPAPFVHRTPYVGREAERADLVRLLDRALQGHGSLVLIGGEPGVGKTRLTEELGTEAARHGMQVLVGRCYETQGSPPYVPFVEILEQALAAAPSPGAFRQVLGDDAPEIAKLVPGLRRLVPDIPPPLDLPPEQERHLLFNSLRDHLARAAVARPMFLVLDDLHWADEGTLLLIEHLAERIGDAPITIVGTYRDIEVTSGHPLARTLDLLLRRRLGHRIALTRLSGEGVAALLQAMSGQEPPPSLVAAIHGETDGNPFFTEEVFKHLAEEGRLYGPDGSFAAGVAIGELDVPESLRLLLGRRLHHLGTHGRRALAAAAVIGRVFTYELLDSLGEIDSGALLDALDDAERARLITPLSEALDEDRLLFSHELIRQTLLTGLSQPRRRRLHLRVADTLERLHRDTLDDHASQIAHHLTQAGPLADGQRLFSTLVRAGRQALGAAGFEEALRHLEQAAALRQVATARQSADLLVQLAYARRSLGGSEAALTTWEEALVAYEALDDREGVARVCAEEAYDLWWTQRDREATDLVERGLRSLGDRPGPERIRMLAWGATVAAWVSPYDVGRDLAEEAVLLADRLDDPTLMGHALGNTALHRFPFYQSRETVAAGVRGAELLRAGGALWDLAFVLGFVAAALVELGRFEEGGQVLDEVAPLADRLGHFGALFCVAWARGPLEFAVQPDLDRIATWARGLFQLGEPMGFESVCYPVLGYVDFLRGDWDAARRLMEEGTRHEVANRLSGLEWGLLFQTLAYRGDRDEALAVLDGHRHCLPRTGEPGGWGSWHLLLCAIEGLAVLGERDQAGALYPLVAEFLASGVILTVFHGRLVERVAGTAATAGRQWEVADGHFRRALRQAEDLPHALEAAETRRFYAAMLGERNLPGDRVRAAGLVGDAIATYRRIGMPRHVDLAEGLLATRP
jgi:class 3 adenylate cyclase/tetratricopeptide (TPR) repeat protein